MRAFDYVEADNVQQLAIKLNKLKTTLNQKDIKIEFVERAMPHHKIDVLYSYEYEKKLPTKGIDQIQHEDDMKRIS